MELAQITAGQVVMLFLLMGTGIAAVKTGVLKPEGKQTLSNLLVYLVVPAMIVNSYRMEFSMEILHNLLASFGMSLLALLIGTGITLALTARRKDSRTPIFRFACIFSNAAYMGFPLISALFGSEGLLYASAYVTVFNILLWTMGYGFVSGSSDPKEVLHSLLHTPVLYAMVISLCIYLLQIPVPQLIFSKLGIAEEYNVRVALYVLATGVTDPEKICADLKLRSRISAESALSFWAGAGLLERYDENAAPGAEPSAPAPMTWAEIAAASRTDPMISSLIDCAQTGFARPLTHSEMEKLVNLYVQEGFAPETVMLCVAYVASRGKRTMAAVLHELKVWRAEGVETGEQADAHLKLLALRQTREQYVASLLGIPDSELTLGGRKAIARWYEVYGYDDAMVQEAAVQAGPKRDLWYWNSILKTWNAKGLRNIHDVRTPVAAAGASRNIRVDRETPSGNDFLKNAARRRTLKKKSE